MDEKIEFTHRLRAAMVQAGYAVSPSVLAVLKLARLDRVFPIRGMEPG